MRKIIGWTIAAPMLALVAFPIFTFIYIILLSFYNVIR